MMAPAGEMTYENAYEMYKEQAGYLVEAGVDLFAAETMINIEETLAAVEERVLQQSAYLPHPLHYRL